MASLTAYRGLQIMTDLPDPPGEGGLAIQDNFVGLVDWNPKSTWNESTSPTPSDDELDDFYPGSAWLRTDTTPPQLFVCESSATDDAVWQQILLSVEQDPSPKLGGDLDVNGHKFIGAVQIGSTGTDSFTINTSVVQIPNGVIFRRPSITGIQESLMAWKITDDLTSSLSVVNGNSADDVFAPKLQGVQSGTDVALNLNGQGASDTGVNPVLLLMGQIGEATVDDRPLLAIRNFTTDAVQISGGYNVRLLGGPDSPTLDSPATDTVSLAAIDKTGDDRRLYLQSEAGSPISLGNDRLNFMASTGRIAIGNTDTLAITTAALTLTDGVDLAVGTTSGTQIATGTSQKLGFYGATPIARRSGSAQTAVSTTSATNSSPYGYTTQAQADGLVTLVNELRAWAVAQGFIKGSA